MVILSRRSNYEVYSKDFLPREYQVELYEKCKQRNTIVCLDTGAGKTFIAVMLIKYYLDQLEDPQIVDPNRPDEILDKIGKRTFFLVPTVPLVKQQAEQISRHIDVRVGQFSGLTFDEFTKEDWLKEMVKYQIFVMVHEIFRRIIQHGFIPLEKCNLLIFDEVHHAIKNHPYREIMSYFDKCPSERRPRILGLSASLINKCIKPDQIEKEIHELEKTMYSSCETTYDLRTLNKYAAKPKEIICYYKSDDELILTEELNMAILMVKELIYFLAENTLNVSLPCQTMPVKTKSLKRFLTDTLYTIKIMGLWSCEKLTSSYVKQLSDVVEMISSTRSIHASIISSVITAMNALRCAIKKILSHVDLQTQLMHYSSRKLRCLLKILKDHNNHYKKEGTDSEKKSDFCGIIFVERRSTSFVLSKWLEKIAEVFSEYHFIKVNYVVGNSSGASTKVTNMPSKRQEETLDKFRKREYNLLTATSVLEEGLDVSRCNLVVRFDFPKNLREYIQSKGRAREENSSFVILIEKEHVVLSNESNVELTTGCYLRKLSDYKSIETSFQKHCHERNLPSDEEAQQSFDEDTLQQPYMPIKKDGAARVTLNSSIALINRYCLKLPSDSFTRLTPQFEISSIDHNGESMFQCKFRFPINSPVRQMIIGLPMPTRKLAKKSAALLGCEALHKAGELDDNLLPVGKETCKIFPEVDELDEEEKNLSKDARPGTTKRRQVYDKRVADVLKNSAPKPDIDCFLYVFKIKLSCPMPEEHNTRGRKINDPAETTKNFGILTSLPVPSICPFPLFTRSGEVIVSLEVVKENIRLSKDQVNKLSTFHQFTFCDVLRLIKKPLLFNQEKSTSRYFVVPIDVNSSGEKDIDWNFVNLIDRQKEQPLRIINEEERANFVFERERYIDAVVIPWYRLDKPQFFFYVAEICDNLNPKSPFPDEGYETFEDYYKKKYKINVVNLNQPLLDVDHTSARLNLLTPRYVNRKGMTLPTSTSKTKKEKRENLQQKQILVPELCNIHPFPASLWRKAVCLPSILFRLNSILVAEQLRSRIARETNIGLVDTSHKQWPALNFGWTLADVLEQQAKEEAEEKKKEGDDDKIEKDIKIEVWEDDHFTSSNENNKDNLTEIQQTEPNQENELIIDEFDPSKYVINYDEIEDVEDDDEELLNAIDWSNIPINIIGSINRGPNGFSSINYPLSSINPIPNNSNVRIREMSDDEMSDDEMFLEERTNGWDNANANANAIANDNTMRVGSPSYLDVKKENDWGIGNEEFTSIISIDNPIGLSYLSTGGSFGLNIKGLSKDLATLPFEQNNLEDESDLDSDDFSDELDLENNIEFDTTFYSNNLTNNVPNDVDYPLLVETPNEITTDDFFGSFKKSNLNCVSNLELIEENFEQREFEDDIHLNAIEEQPNVFRQKISSIFDDIDDSDESSNQECNLIDDEISNNIKENTQENVKNEYQEKSPRVMEENIKNKEQEYPGFGELLPNRDINCDNYEGMFRVRFDPLKENENEIGPSPSTILQALTMSNASDGINLERLETIGDSFLKYAVTSFLYIVCPREHEGKLSHARSRQISNMNLYKLGKKIGIGELMNATKFEPNDNWCPPCYWTSNNMIENPKTGDIENIPYDLLTQHSIPDKSIADCVEALIGAYLISNGPKGAILFMKWLGLKITLDQPEYDLGELNKDEIDPIWHWLPQPKSSIAIELNENNENIIEQYLNDQFKKLHLSSFEEKIGYEFRDKAYLVQAFTHNSNFENLITDCYQRLEFLGDAILDYLITRYLYEDPRDYSPGVLTDLRSALVNNTFFASLSVKYDFHKFLKMIAPSLFPVINSFVKKVKQSDGRINDHHFITEDETENSEDVEVPKALGDIFESVAGAIYLDSGMSLDKVWHVYFKMMKPEIEYFSTHVPKSPIRELLEMEPQNAKFSKPEPIPGKKTRVRVDVFGVGQFIGEGRNKRIAKCIAAKKALRALKSKKSQID